VDLEREAGGREVRGETGEEKDRRGEREGKEGEGGKRERREGVWPRNVKSDATVFSIYSFRTFSFTVF